MCITMEDIFQLKISKCIPMTNVFQSPIDTPQKPVHTLLHSWIIRSDLYVNVILVYSTAISNKTGNLCQDGLQARLVPMAHGWMEILPVNMIQIWTLPDKRLQIRYSTLDA